MSQSGNFLSNSGPGGFIQTVTGNAGPAVTPTAGNINIVGTGNVTTTGAASTLTISLTGPASFSWSVITIDQTAAVNKGYICNKAGTLALLLPVTSSVGDIIRVTGINTALGWQITQGAGQQIFLGAAPTTLGALGSLTSSDTRDSIEIVCVVANLTWNVLSVQGNIAVV